MKNGYGNGSGKVNDAASRLAAMAAEHKKLGTTIADVRKLLAEEYFSWDAVRTSLADLRASLEAHFVMEEAGGYLAEVLTRAPEKNLAVARLESDHSRMRGMLASALAEALVARSRDELRNSVEKVLVTLIDHERRENEIVQDTFSTDIPAAD